MPLGIATTPAFKPDEVVVAVSGFTTGKTKPEMTIAAGTRLRGDHPAVKAHPRMFVREGDPDALRARRSELWDQVIDQENPDDLERAARAAAREIPLEHRLVVVRDFSLGMDGSGPLGRGILLEAQYKRGAVVDRRDEKLAKIIADAPGWFAVRLDWINDAAKLKAQKGGA